MAAGLEDPGFAGGLFTAAEVDYCSRHQLPAQHFAARFAAKEAMLKALASAGKSGWYWKEIEILNDPEGAPTVILHGRIRAVADEMGVRRIQLSLSHTRELAIASVLLED